MLKTYLHSPHRLYAETIILIVPCRTQMGLMWFRSHVIPIIWLPPLPYHTPTASDDYGCSECSDAVNSDHSLRRFTPVSAIFPSYLSSPTALYPHRLNIPIPLVPSITIKPIVFPKYYIIYSVPHVFHATSFPNTM